MSAAMNTDVQNPAQPLMHSQVLAQCRFPGSQYSDAERITVALCYLVHGNVHRVAKETGFPSRTIYEWTAQEWWEPLLTEIRELNGQEFEDGLRENIRLALGAVKDRLENGDAKLVKGKDGEYIEKRVRVGAKDSAIIAAVHIDKLRLSRGDPTAIVANAGPSDKALRKIAQDEIKAARMKNVVSEQ